MPELDLLKNSVILKIFKIKKNLFQREQYYIIIIPTHAIGSITWYL